MLWGWHGRQFQLLREVHSFESENSLRLQSAQFLPSPREDKCVILRGQQACWKPGNLRANVKYVEVISSAAPGVLPMRMQRSVASGPVTLAFKTSAATAAQETTRHRKKHEGQGRVTRDSCGRLHLISRRPGVQKRIMGTILFPAPPSASICEISGS